MRECVYEPLGTKAYKGWMTYYDRTADKPTQNIKHCFADKNLKFLRLWNEMNDHKLNLIMIWTIIFFNIFPSEIKLFFFTCNLATPKLFQRYSDTIVTVLVDFILFFVDFIDYIECNTDGHNWYIFQFISMI